jgi:Aspartyl protease
MPCIAGNFGPAGILTQVAIFKDKQHIAQLQTAGPTAPAQLTLYMALLDTGASGTCISPKIVADLNLVPVGKANMISASHVTPANQYFFSVGFPIGLAQTPTGLMSGNFHVFENITGLEFKPAGATYDVLLGMDILAKGALTLDFQGRWCFSF